MNKDLIACIKKAKEEFFKLKEELGIKKDIENWGNMSVSVMKDRNYYRLILIFSIGPGKNDKVYIEKYPITTPKEEIQKTEEYKKAKKLSEIFKIIKHYKELENACERFDRMYRES